ncbi:Hypothetical predicted protein [Paramuricea clavata]|uniref:Uncharacterized protein n=1 Tax=Paramuricea clavata TaxID=317549 RepID=A0A6S7JJ74_PARCT|nr:Hypothetical predicted protein [Paramuricea clavata]
MTKHIHEVERARYQPPLLKFYEPEKELVIQCDASEGGLGAALLQDDRPIAYASRALNSTERNYAQIEKELLAIVFAAERFHQYTFGRPVCVDSDHKPLETIFAKPLVSAPRRLQRMLMRLQMYDLSVRYKRRTELYLADTLSRHYLTAVQETREADVLNYLSDVEIEQGEHEEIMEINQLLASEDVANMYRDKTDQNEDLQVLKRVIQSGWPVVKNNLPAAVGSYFHIRDELVVQDGLILRGDRLVIPKAHRKTMMESLHGIEADVEIEQGEHKEIMEINQLLANEDVANMYRDKTDQDEDLQVLKRVIQSGWPVVKNNLPAAVGSYFHIRDELVVQDGLILRGDRLLYKTSNNMESLKQKSKNRDR